MMNNYVLSDFEKNAILTKLLEQEIGYKQAHDLIDAAYEAFDPVGVAVEYAVKDKRQELEPR